MDRQAQFMTILSFDLQPAAKNISNGISTPQIEQMCQIISNPCINVEVMARQAQFMTILSFDLQV